MAAAIAPSVLSLTLFLLLLLLSPAVFADHHKHKNTTSSPFDFLKHLQGCHKGDKIKGVKELKKYMEQFGYLHYGKNHSHANDDDFDDLLEIAIKEYQLNYHLKPTGILNAKTVTKMMMPRCGVADIINGTTRMRSGKKRQNPHFHTVSHFSFFSGSPKWTKSHLTYALRDDSRSDAIAPVDNAFATWAANTHFTFSKTRDFANADIKISFRSGDHGDGAPFEGRGGTLAHAFAPENGRFHYDADEPWSANVVPGAFHLETVALHEIGHLLGLGHSDVQGAVMAPAIAPGVSQSLHGDDIQGIRALYNQ